MMIEVLGYRINILLFVIPIVAIMIIFATKVVLTSLISKIKNSKSKRKDKIKVKSNNVDKSRGSSGSIRRPDRYVDESVEIKKEVETSPPIRPKDKEKVRVKPDKKEKKEKKRSKVDKGSSKMKTSKPPVIESSRPAKPTSLKKVEKVKVSKKSISKRKRNEKPKNEVLVHEFFKISDWQKKYILSIVKTKIINIRLQDSSSSELNVLNDIYKYIEESDYWEREGTKYFSNYLIKLLFTDSMTSFSNGHENRAVLLLQTIDAINGGFPGCEYGPYSEKTDWITNDFIPIADYSTLDRNEKRVISLAYYIIASVDKPLSEIGGMHQSPIKARNLSTDDLEDVMNEWESTQFFDEYSDKARTISAWIIYDHIRLDLFSGFEDNFLNQFELSHIRALASIIDKYPYVEILDTLVIEGEEDN